MARLQSAASAFLDDQRHKLEQAAHEKAVAMMAILGFTLLALVGTVLLLLGLSFWLEPQLGLGPAFALVGGLVAIASIVTVVVLQSSGKSMDHEYRY
jgi:hypothetical protein